MQLFEPGVESLIERLLPMCAGGVAKEDAASEGADRMDGAQSSGLKGATGRIAIIALVNDARQITHEGAQLDCRDVKPMAKFVKPATAAGYVAPRPARFDFPADLLVELADGKRNLLSPGRREHRFGQ